MNAINEKMSQPCSYEPLHSAVPSPHYMLPEGLQERDLTLKIWIRGLKLFSRILGAICSAVVIGLSATSFNIFLATKDLDPIEGFVPWARPTLLWPQILTLTVAVISFLVTLIVLWNYIRRGHRSAEKASYLITIATVFGFVAWIVIWATAGASMQHIRATSEGRDFWGWACAKNTRRAVFQDKVNYDLVCTMQDWNFICTMIHVATVVMAVVVWIFGLWRLEVKSRLQRADA